MQKTILLLLLGCVAYTNAVETSSLRQKLMGLAQLSASSANLTDCEDIQLDEPVLGDLSGDLLDWCPDEFGGEEVSLGSGLQTSALSTLQLNQLQSVSSVPDQMQNTTVQAICNSCNAAAHTEASQASRIRTFDISGQICVEENVKFKEIGEERERAQGASEKLGVCVLTNEGTEDNTIDGLGSLEACSDNGGVSYTPRG